MIESVINKINDTTTGIGSLNNVFAKINGLCEFVEEEFTIGEQTVTAKFPALYQGKDQLHYITHFDYKTGVVFHLTNGDQTETELEKVRVREKRVERTWPMRLVAIVRRDVYNTDNAYSATELLSNLQNKISKLNIVELRTTLGVDKVITNITGASHDKQTILNEVFENVDFQAQHNLMVVRVDYEIVISGNERCFTEFGCPVNDVDECGTLALSDITTTIENGVAYSSTISTTGGTAPYVYAITSGALPSSLSLNTSTGEITGTANDEANTYNFTVGVTDSEGCTASRSYSIEVTCPEITLGDIETTATEGEAYSDTPSVTGGTGPYTFAVTLGALPNGLNLNINTGEISGTPTVADLFNFTITVTDSNNCTGSRAYSIEVSSPPPPIPFDDLMLWLKADEGPVLSGSNVIQWQDQSGNGFHADEIPGENTPELIPNVINGLPVVEWDNDKLLYTGSFIPSADQLTIYIVLNAQVPGSYGWLWQMAGGQDNSSVSVVSVQGILALYGFFWAGSFAITNYSTPSTTGQFYLLTIRINNSQPIKQRLYKDGVLDNTSTDAPFSPTVEGYKLGHLYAGGYLFPFIGQLAEFIVYNVEHGDVTAAAIETYLQTKYGL